MNVYGIAIVGDGLRQIDIEGTEKKFYRLEDIKEAKFAVYPRKKNKQEADRLEDPSTQSEGTPVLKPELAAEQQQYKIDDYKKEIEEAKKVLALMDEYAEALASSGGKADELYFEYVKPLLDGYFKGSRRDEKVELKKLLEEIRKNYNVRAKKRKEKEERKIVEQKREEKAEDEQRQMVQEQSQPDDSVVNLAQAMLGEGEENAQ